MTDRETVLDAVQRMPEKASIAEIMDRLAMLASVKEGLAQSDRGEGVPHEEVGRMVESWITKSSGRRAA